MIKEEYMEDKCAHLFELQRKGQSFGLQLFLMSYLPGASWYCLQQIFWFVLLFRMLVIMQVTTCRIWHVCTSKLPPFLYACAKYTTMLSITLKSYLGNYLLKMQMLGAFCLVCCAVALTIMFNWLCAWFVEVLWCIFKNTPFTRWIWKFF